MQGRQPFSNTRCLFNIIYSELDLDTSELVVSLDTERMFDRVEWVFLFDALHRFGFGANFVVRVKLYTHPP